MSQKLDRKIRKEIRAKMSHEFEILKQMMIPAPKNRLLNELWHWGLKFYFKEEIDYNPSKRHAVDLPGVVAEEAEIQEAPVR